MQELNAQALIVHAILQRQIEYTQACMASGGKRSLDLWRAMSREVVLQMKSAGLSYAPNTIWNMLWALDMTSESPLRLSDLAEAPI